MTIAPPTSTSFNQAQFDAAKSLISEDSLVNILCKIVDVASPTGEEGPLANQIVTLLNEYNLEGTEQKIDDVQSNAVGSIQGREPDRYPSLLLYAPIDTVTSNNPEEDLPWIGPEMLPEMWAKSRTDGTYVYGLGAHNPKGHAACIIEAARVLRAANIPLRGDLMLGFGAGGMPTNARQGLRPDSGHGVGCDFMLSNSPKPDSAVIAKSGWSISWEEVGLIWFEVKVKGIHNYSGARHLMPYVNPIIDAGKLIEKIDVWLLEWSEKHRSGLVAPQGVVSFIESGWERMPSFTPAVCRFRVDLRISPRTSPDEAEKEFAQVLNSFCEDLGIEASYEGLVAIPGASTSEHASIIQHSIKSWETVTGDNHTAAKGMSGATDANILRGHGIPTARVGLQKAKIPNIDFQQGMNTVAIKDLYELTVLLVHIAISFCNKKKLRNG